MARRAINEDSRALSRPAIQRTAATYSPNWWVSTIGDGELNFSVRNGKRWVLTAIATAIYCLRDTRLVFTRLTVFVLVCSIGLFFSLEKVSRAISTGQLKPSQAVHFLPINVVVSHDPMGKSHLGDGFALRCFQRLS